jgi:hypothetical protein
MGVLGAVERTAQSYPSALLFVALGLLAGTIWAYRRERYWTMSAMTVLTAASVLIFENEVSAQAASMGRGTFVGFPGSVSAGKPAVPWPSGGGGPPGRRSLGTAYFSSSTRLHPRYPADFPLPPTFALEHSSGGARQGDLTIRFRFQGEGDAAVRDLVEMGKRNGWEPRVLAPHRVLFQKGNRTISAWLSFPGHSLVLDIAEPR